MRTILVLLLLFLTQSYLLVAQVSITSDGSDPDNSAMLDVKATDRGLLLPRLSTTARDILPSPETGLLIYNSSESRINYFNGSYWIQLESESSSSITGSLQAGGGTLILTSGSGIPKSSAILDIDDSSRGILIPRTTPGLISSPAEGLMIYNSSTNLLDYYNGTEWISLCGISSGIAGATGTQTVSGVAINTSNMPPHHSAVLDVEATDKGILIPRLTKAQRETILPDPGLIVYNTQTDLFEYYTGTEWRQVLTTFLEPPVPEAAVPAKNTITWNWDGIPDALGYKWNTVDDYATAIDQGTLTSYEEAGLTCETEYTRYIWAYNGCGASVSVSMTESTLDCFICGDNIVINHIAGDVAPVTKTVTYGTVSGVPGETTLCWITSNLGADHQATAVNDATEECAGWYWQFNRKQGYKHDGTTRTPNTTWETLIDENTIWDDANDPCTIEMGEGWRLPTQDEWTNVDASGMWTNWYGPWNSLLKMHAAGYLYNQNGNLYTRGSSGNYWSSDQYNSYSGIGLYFRDVSCIVDGGSKAFGLSVRCVHE